MTVNDARTIAEALYDAKPDYKDPAYTLWLRTVSAFLIFAEEANPVIDIDRLEKTCEEVGRLLAVLREDGHL